MTNIQARWKIDSETWSKWRDCGNVRHVDAAQSIAIWLWRMEPQEIQTRDESRPDVLYSHTVTREVTYRVVAHRGDDDVKQITDVVW